MHQLKSLLKFLKKQMDADDYEVSSIGEEGFDIPSVKLFPALSACTKVVRINVRPENDCFFIGYRGTKLEYYFDENDNLIRIGLWE